VLAMAAQRLPLLELIMAASWGYQSRMVFDLEKKENIYSSGN
jgi:hypothetical protein